VRLAVTSTGQLLVADDKNLIHFWEHDSISEAPDHYELRLNHGVLCLYKSGEPVAQFNSPIHAEVYLAVTHEGALIL
jgi:hypothetical protein